MEKDMVQAAVHSSCGAQANAGNGSASPPHHGVEPAAKDDAGGGTGKAPRSTATSVGPCDAPETPTAAQGEGADAQTLVAGPGAALGPAERRRRRWPAALRYARLQPHVYPMVLAATVVVMTGWWIAGLVLHRHDLGWVVPFLVWLAICLRIVALHPPTRRRAGALVRGACAGMARWRDAGRRASPALFRMHRHAPLAVATAAVVLVGTFGPAAAGSNTRANRAVSLLGLAVFLGSFYATSRNRRRVNVRAVLGGTMAQFLLGLFVLKTKAGYDIFDFVGRMAKDLLGYAGDGTAFLTRPSVVASGWFLVTVAPAVIFFVSFVQLLQFWGWLGWLVGHFATVFSVLLGVSGAEAVVAAASPFVGQGESAVLIQEYMPRLTHAELHQIMTSGFASIAGSVMSAYMQMGISPVAIVSSCVMSIPASIALSKLRYPETEQPATGGPVPTVGGHEHAAMEEGRAQPRPPPPAPQPGQQQDQEAAAHERPHNALHAMGLGSWLGLKIAGMIVASVLCIMALLGLANGLLGWWGGYVNVPQLSVQLVMGYLLYPVAFLLGIDRSGGDLRKVAELLGIKIVANEFVAYGTLTTDPAYATLSPRSRLIAMYALCGFGNFSAVGIQIGALAQLAPRRAGDVADVAFSALVTGIVATLTSATVAGMLLSGDELL